MILVSEMFDGDFIEIGFVFVSSNPLLAEKIDMMPHSVQDVSGSLRYMAQRFLEAHGGGAPS